VFRKGGKKGDKRLLDWVVTAAFGVGVFSKERRKGAFEGTTTVRYSKILMLAVDGMPAAD
jgi:hypothetical protein